MMMTMGFHSVAVIGIDVYKKFLLLYILFLLLYGLFPIFVQVYTDHCHRVETHHDDDDGFPFGGSDRYGRVQKIFIILYTVSLLYGLFPIFV